MDLENRLNEKGYINIAGVDEAGRGALAGPLVAAACIMPKDERINGVKDSKKLKASTREELFITITEKALDYRVITVSPKEIDEEGIQASNLKALTNAISSLSIRPGYILCDFYELGFENSLSLAKGESHSYTIACASIIAKVTRDRLMEEYHSKYPAYDFMSNKGYGTNYHMSVLKAQGPSPIHRISFNSVREMRLF